MEPETLNIVVIGMGYVGIPCYCMGELGSAKKRRIE